MAQTPFDFPRVPPPPPSDPDAELWRMITTAIFILWATMTFIALFFTVTAAKQ